MSGMMRNNESMGIDRCELNHLINQYEQVKESN